MRESTVLIYSPKLMTTFSFKLDKITNFVYCVGGSLKNLCHFEMGVWQMLTSSGGRSMLGRRGNKICQNLADVICERAFTISLVRFTLSRYNIVYLKGEIIDIRCIMYTTFSLNKRAPSKK